MPAPKRKDDTQKDMQPFVIDLLQKSKQQIDNQIRTLENEKKQAEYQVKLQMQRHENVKKQVEDIVKKSNALIEKAWGKDLEVGKAAIRAKHEALRQVKASEEQLQAAQAKVGTFEQQIKINRIIPKPQPQDIKELANNGQLVMLKTLISHAHEDLKRCEQEAKRHGQIAKASRGTNKHAELTKQNKAEEGVKYYRELIAKYEQAGIDIVSQRRLVTINSAEGIKQMSPKTPATIDPKGHGYAEMLRRSNNSYTVATSKISKLTSFDQIKIKRGLIEHVQTNVARQEQHKKNAEELGLPTVSKREPTLKEEDVKSTTRKGPGRR